MAIDLALQELRPRRRLRDLAALPPPPATGHGDHRDQASTSPPVCRPSPPPLPISLSPDSLPLCLPTRGARPPPWSPATSQIRRPLSVPGPPRASRPASPAGAPSPSRARPQLPPLLRSWTQHNARSLPASPRTGKTSRTRPVHATRPGRPRPHPVFPQRHHRAGPRAAW